MTTRASRQGRTREHATCVREPACSRFERRSRTRLVRVRLSSPPLPRDVDAARAHYATRVCTLMLSIFPVSLCHDRVRKWNERGRDPIGIDRCRQPRAGCLIRSYKYRAIFVQLSDCDFETTRSRVDDELISLSAKENVSSGIPRLVLAGMTLRFQVTG